MAQIRLHCWRPLLRFWSSCYLAVLIASAAGGELIKAARYFGDRSTQEGERSLILAKSNKSRCAGSENM